MYDAFFMMQILHTLSQFNCPSLNIFKQFSPMSLLHSEGSIGTTWQQSNDTFV